MEAAIDLKDLIRKVTVETKFLPEMLEKDFHLTRILHKIAERQIEDLVFKGGTCLNKCYLGFHRLSEDLDFVYNKDVNDFSRTQVKNILDGLRREIFEILGSLGLKTNKRLGEGWQMLTSKLPQKIIGLMITATYLSIIDGSTQKIKIEVSFRKKLKNPTEKREISHKFIDALGEPVLAKNIKIEVIDLAENFAEKFRALITRKLIAIRDIYDIHFILRNEILAVDKEIIDLIIVKVNETKKFTRDELDEFIKNLHAKSAELNYEEIKAILKADEDVDIKKMTNLIITKFFSRQRSK